MRVQNRVYAGTAVSVRTSSYDGDADGVFDMADEHAAMVLTMQGWSKPSTKTAKPIVSAAPAAPPEAAPAAPPEAAPAAPPEAAPAAPPEAAPDADEAAPDAIEAAPDADEAAPDADEAAPDADEAAPASEEAVEGPDLLAITTRAEMLRVAAEHNVALSSAQRKMSVDELRAIVDAAIYGAVEVAP